MDKKIKVLGSFFFIIFFASPFFCFADGWWEGRYYAERGSWNPDFRIEPVVFSNNNALRGPQVKLFWNSAPPDVVNQDNVTGFVLNYYTISVYNGNTSGASWQVSKDAVDNKKEEIVDLSQIRLTFSDPMFDGEGRPLYGIYDEEYGTPIILGYRNSQGTIVPYGPTVDEEGYPIYYNTIIWQHLHEEVSRPLREGDRIYISVTADWARTYPILWWTQTDWTHRTAGPYDGVVHFHTEPLDRITAVRMSDSDATSTSINGVQTYSVIPRYYDGSATPSIRLTYNLERSSSDNSQYDGLWVSRGARFELYSVSDNTVVPQRVQDVPGIDCLTGKGNTNYWFQEKSGDGSNQSSIVNLPNAVGGKHYQLRILPYNAFGASGTPVVYDFWTDLGSSQGFSVGLSKVSQTNTQNTAEVNLSLGLATGISEVFASRLRLYKVSYYRVSGGTQEYLGETAGGVSFNTAIPVNASIPRTAEQQTILAVPTFYNQSYSDPVWPDHGQSLTFTVPPRAAVLQSIDYPATPHLVDAGSTKAARYEVKLNVNGDYKIPQAELIPGNNVHHQLLFKNSGGADISFGVTLLNNTLASTALNVYGNGDLSDDKLHYSFLGTGALRNTASLTLRTLYANGDSETGNPLGLSSANSERAKFNVPVNLTSAVFNNQALGSAQNLAGLTGSGVQVVLGSASASAALSFKLSQLYRNSSGQESQADIDRQPGALTDYEADTLSVLLRKKVNGTWTSLDNVGLSFDSATKVYSIDLLNAGIAAQLSSGTNELQLVLRESLADLGGYSLEQGINFVVYFDVAAPTLVGASFRPADLNEYTQGKVLSYEGLWASGRYVKLGGLSGGDNAELARIQIWNNSTEGESSPGGVPVTVALSRDGQGNWSKSPGSLGSDTGFAEFSFSPGSGVSSLSEELLSALDLSWPLSEGPDGERFVRLRLIDRAGNQSEVLKVRLGLDRTAPTLDLSGFSFADHAYSAYGSSSVALNLVFGQSSTAGAGEQIKGAYGTVNGGVLTFGSPNASQFTASATVGLGVISDYNRALPVSLRLYDRAGNVLAQNYTVYSPPFVGSLGVPEQVLAPGADGAMKYRLTWPVTGGGAASYELVAVSPTGTSVAPSYNNDPANPKVSLELPSTYKHAPYSVYLVSRNAVSDDGKVVSRYPTGGDQNPLLSSGTVRNNPISLTVKGPLPTAANPEVYVNDNLSLKWTASDADLDDLTAGYRLYLKSSAQGGFTEVSAWVPLARDGDRSSADLSLLRDPTTAYQTRAEAFKQAFFGTPQGWFENNGVYSWKVSLSDGYGSTEEKGGTFVYDKELPVLSMEGSQIANGRYVKKDETVAIRLSENSGYLKPLGEDASGANARLVVTRIEEAGSTAIDNRGLELTKREGVWSYDYSLGDASVWKAGTYAFRLLAADAAGNDLDPALDTYYFDVDLESPLLKDARFTEYRGVSVAKQDLAWAELSVRDNAAGTASAEYRLKTGEGSVGEWQRIGTPLGISGPEGEGYGGGGDRGFDVRALSDNQSGVLELRVLDAAGNPSNSLSRTILMDRTTPKPGLSLGGGLVVGGLRYVSDFNDIAGAATVLTTESASPITSVEWDLFEVNETGLEPAPEWRLGSSAEVLADLSPEAGKYYRVRARVKNSVGTGALATSEVFRFVPASPEGFGILGGIGETLGRGEGSVLVLERTEALTPIKKITIAPELEGEPVSPWPAFEVAKPSSNVVAFSVPSSAREGTYLLKLRVEDALGRTSDFDDATWKVDVNDGARELTVKDSGPYIAERTQAKGSWDYRGQRTLGGLDYSLEKNGQPLGSWKTYPEGELAAGKGDFDLPIPEAEEVSFADVFKIRVRASFADGAGLETVSRGFRLDLSKAVFELSPGIEGPGYSTREHLSLSWDVRDEESGLASVRVQAKRLVLGEDGEALLEPLSDWMDFGAEGRGRWVRPDLSRGGQAPSLADGEKIYWAIQVRNGAGAISEKTSAPTVIDESEPSPVAVLDQGQYINPVLFVKDGLEYGDSFRFSWPSGGLDVHSPVSFEWALANPSDLGNLDDIVWQEYEGEAGSRSIEYSLEALRTLEGDPYGPALGQGKTLIALVKTRNAAGLSVLAYSNGIIYDETAPYLPKIGVSNSAGGLDQSYINPQKGYYVNYRAVDPESAIEQIEFKEGTATELGEFAKFEEGYEKVLEGLSSNPAEGTEEVVSGVNSEGLVLLVKGTSANGVNIEAEGYNGGALVDTIAPTLSNPRGFYYDEILNFEWETEFDGSPIIAYQYALLPQSRGSPAEGDWTSLATDQSSLRIQTRGEGGEVLVQDGTYRLFVQALDAAKNVSAFANSNPVIVDTQAPELSEADSLFPKYVSHAVAYTLTGSDGEGSGVEEYQVILGSRTNPLAYEGEWKSYSVGELGNGSLKKTIDFASLAPQPEDRARIYLYYRIKDRSGLWSQTYESPMLVDQTQAVLSENRLPPYTTDKNRIGGLSFKSLDGESGLVAYKVRVMEKNEAGTYELYKDYPNPKSITSGSEEVFATEFENLELGGIEPGMSHDRYYRVEVSVQNGTGDWSAYAASEATLVDLVAPSLNFDRAAGEIIINDGQPREVGYTMDEDVMKLVFTLRKPGGEASTVAAHERTSLDEAFHPVFTFSEGQTGIYVLEAEVTDKAGYVTVIAGSDELLAHTSYPAQRIRINTRPIFVLPQGVVTTPGKPNPVVLRGFYDPDDDEASFTFVLKVDGVEKARVVWNKGESGNQGIDQRVLALPYTFYQAEATDPGAPPQSTSYALSLVMIDSSGKESESQEGTLVVENTKSGRLYADEYWAGTHELRGSVLVPEGLSLTVVPETTVTAGPGSDFEYDHYLDVEGNLEVKTGSLFTSSSELARWGGIRVKGALSLEGSVILEKAQRALVFGASASSGELKDLVIRDSDLGIHVLGSSLSLERLNFLRIRDYGIKLDSGGNAKVKDSSFVDTPNVYYEGGRILSLEQLNGRGEGFGGNTQGGEER